ncbi:NAD(P)/FAD-dependent oxidoreductase [Cohnella lubricantis]|uniref:Ferredoxin--NADP reductase n=1 Tax=Cohnella lubricantis TaxID=2163172 RepID=A0A841TAG1_9BACL|nr:NAD(P)/FAD-dependent oxidoreductase [Cohnella lubricantis]MBB6677056.1 NAD(P)/FAD-dependent oxidoreductase [Cohnella lubricantis]MBP2118903.1 thioredoxin reductase (NADPH) [Cohnella lubricantis]
MNREEELFDVTIIGGGPVGLFSAFYCGMRELKTKVIECAAELGGKVHFYPDKVLHDIGGIAAITGAEFIEQVVKQGKTFSPEIVLNERIHGLQRLDDGAFELTAESGRRHYTRTIILTIGHGVFVPIKLEQAGVEIYEGRQLHYAVDDIERFRGKRVVISGGGDSAVDWANAIEPIAVKLTVVHRRDEFWGHESSVTRMRNSSAEVLTPYQLDLVAGDGDRIEHVTVRHAETNETLVIEADEVLVNHGIRGDFGGIRGWGLAFDDERIVVNAKMETNIPGIYAAGDVVTHPGKLKLIAGGFMEGPMAVNSAKAYLAPQEEVAPLYSTHHDKLIAMRG